MKGKYTHKFIIYHKNNIENDYGGLVSQLVELLDTIPLDLHEELCEESPMFEDLRREFLSLHKDQLWAVEEILAIDDETNVKCNKVLAFVNKYPEFGELVCGIDYFDGEDEYIERFGIPLILNRGFGEFNSKSGKRIYLSYFYGVKDNQLNILLKEMGMVDLIQY